MKTRRSVAIVLLAVVVVSSMLLAVSALETAVQRGSLVKPRVTKAVTTTSSADDDAATAATAMDYAFVEVKTLLHAHNSAESDSEVDADAEGVPSDKPQVAPASHEMTPDPKDQTQIHGKIKLNGQHFKTDCDCKEVKGPDMRFSKDDPCVTPPSKFRVRQEAFNRHMGLTPSQLKGLLGRPQDATFVKVDDSSFGTTDARETEPILATPGGDFGEFFLALAEYETLTKRAFSVVEVKKILSAWLDWAPRGAQPLTLQTDETATLHLQQNLHYNGEKGKVVALDLETPKPEYETELLKDLPASKNQGCYYVKAILDDPSRFYVRRELLPALLQSFFKILWDKTTLSSDGTPLHKKLRLNMLQGEPAPKAWINFRASQACERAHMAPLFRPFPVTTARVGKLPEHIAPVIVNHPEAAKVVRKRTAKFFSLFNPMLSEEQFIAKLNHRGNTYMEIAAEVLGSQVPYYTVTME